MKRRWFFSLCLLIVLTGPALAKMVNGVVVYVDSDVIVIATTNGLTVGELYGGYYALNEEDVVVGELESYGFKDVYCPTSGREARVYVDDFWLSKEDAIRWVQDKK